MAIGGATTAAAAKQVFKRVVDDVYDQVTKVTGNKLKQWNTQRKIEQLYTQISKVRMVKTIWQVDKAVDLTAFYCDSHVVIDGVRKVINRISDFDTNDNLVIQGTAGQGKSIFLRHLCASELALGTFVPIFVELRRIRKGHTLRQRIFSEFQSLGLDVDDTLFHALAKSGRVLLLLDAYDEVPDDEKNSVLTEIEDLVSTHQKLRVIVTSRPYNDIQMSRHLCVVKLDDLKDDEYKAVIHRLGTGTNLAERLINHIESDNSDIEEMLNTPLMVTLLVLSYKSHSELPNTLSEFYGALFQTLLRRHDGTKPGFTRRRSCQIDDGQYRLGFEALCLLAKGTPGLSFTAQKLREIVANAITRCDINARPDEFLDDIVRITCLIVKDGEEHRFIHKTVQEYHAASFVARRPDEFAKAFYARLVAEPTRDWTQELEFLSEIDRHRFNSYYLLPSILRILCLTEEELISVGSVRELAEDRMSKVLDSILVGAVVARSGGDHSFGWKPSVGPIADRHQMCFVRPILWNRNSILHKEVQRRAHADRAAASSLVEELDASKDSCLVPLLEVSRRFEIEDQVRRASLPIYIKLVKVAKDLHRSIAESERADILDALF